MARRAKKTSTRRRGALLAFVFSVFMTMLAFSVLVLIRDMLVLFVLTSVLVFFPLVFTTAAVMFGLLHCLLTISFNLLLRNNTSVVNSNVSFKILHLFKLWKKKFALIATIH